METTPIKLTKSVLNKVIQWSSTKYNDWLGYGTKKENVDKIYSALVSGSYNGQKVFEVQSASPSGETHNGKNFRYWKTKSSGSHYIIDCDVCTITNKHSGETLKFFVPDKKSSK